MSETPTSAVTKETYEKIKARLSAVTGEATEEIHALHEASLLPPTLLHHFACDCAERALDRDEAAGHTAPEALRAAIDARRKSLAGTLDDTLLESYIIQARDAAHAASVRQKAHESAAAAADAGSDLIYAVRAAAWAVAAAGHAVPATEEADARVQESRWQVQHLLALLQAG